MTTREIPCGCRIIWDEWQTKILMCAFHQLRYVVWRGTDLEFIKRIMTPSLQKLDMAEIRPSYC